jgi:glycosyltransferase involved in cell wall biosynthesis
MKVLTVTNMLPYSKKIFYGIFVQEQVEALSYYHPEISNKIWFIRGYLSKLIYIWSVFSLNWHLLFHRYDIIHIHSALSGIFLLFAPKRKNVVITLHGTEILDSGQYRVSKQVIKKAKYLICVSDEIEQKIKQSPLKATTCIIPCAVRDWFFVDNRTRNDNTIKIAFASARWRDVKNYPLFEEIISRLKNVYSIDIQTIEFDNKTREEICADLNEVDLLLMTSFHEGSPQIIKEAMCCNTPVVSSNVGTVRFMLDGVENCRVIDGYNPEEYVAAITEILRKAENGSPLRSSGRKRILDLKYDEETITLQIKQVYDSVFNSNRKSCCIKQKKTLPLDNS